MNFNFKHFILLSCLSITQYAQTKKLMKSPPVAQEKSSNVKEVSIQTYFDAYINGNIPVIVKFYSPACAHCKATAGAYDELSLEYDPQDVIFLAVNGDENAIADDYDVEGYPTFVYVKSGKVVHKKSGANPITFKESITKEIKQYLGASVKNKKTESTTIASLKKRSHKKLKKTA